MKSMVASRVETARLTSKLLVLGLCLGFTSSYARAQTEESPSSAEPAASEPKANEPKTEEGMSDKIKDKVKQLKDARQINRKETSDALVQQRGKEPEAARYVMIGEAQTLPEKVIRFDLVNVNVAGNQSFEKGGGARKDVGIDVVANIRAYVLSYGITDKISFQMLVPTVTSNQLTINATKFRDSKLYAKNYNKVMEGIIPYLMTQTSTTCGGKTYDECLAIVNKEEVDPSNEFHLPVKADMVLPTGEVYTNKENVSVRRAADSMVLNGARPNPNGKTGVGDIALGVLYNAFTKSNQKASLGLGLRLPTGEGSDEKSSNRTGPGFTTAAFVVKYDFQVIDPFIVSFSNQTEWNLKNAHYRRHSVINPEELNTADVNTVNSLTESNRGDGVSNNYEVSKKVPSNSGYLRVGYALGAINPMLNTLSVLGFYGWAFNPEIFHDGQSQQNESKQTSYTYRLSFDGLGLQPRIPVGLSISQERLLSGNGVAVAAVTTNIGLSLYYKF